jgi:phosphatidylglycerophosphatase A
MEKINKLLATGFGTGLLPFMPGTFGTLPGVLIALAMTGLPIVWQCGIAAVLTLMAIPICSAGERIFRLKDDRRIVADEYLTFPICVIGLPIIQEPVMLGIAFVVCRILDIIKPFPAFASQKLKGGLGITADDFISNIYALGVNWAIYKYVYYQWITGFIYG